MDRGERLSQMLEKALEKAKSEERIQEIKVPEPVKKPILPKVEDFTIKYDTTGMSRSDVTQKLKELREYKTDILRDKKKPDYYNPKSLKQKISFLRNVQKIPYPTSWFKKNEAITEDIFKKQYARWLRSYESLKKEQDRIDRELEKIEAERNFWKKELEKIPTKKQLKEQAGRTKKERERLNMAKLEEEERLEIFKEKLDSFD